MTNDVKNEVVEPQNEIESQNDNELDTQDQNEVEILKKQLAEARKEAAERRIKLKNIESEAQAKQQKLLEEQGNFKELYEKSNAELQSIKQNYETLEQKAKAFDEYQEAEKKKLLSELPKDVRKDFEELDLPKLQKVYEGFKKKDSILATEQQHMKPSAKTFSQLFHENLKG